MFMFKIAWLLPWKLTYPLKIDGWKMKCPFKLVPFLWTFVHFRGNFFSGLPFTYPSNVLLEVLGNGALEGAFKAGLAVSNSW